MPGMDYVALRKEVIDAGLLERQYGYYAFKMVFNFALLALGIFILATVDNFALQLLNAAFLAFVFTQFGFIMHDAVHKGIFKGDLKNKLVGIITGSLIINISSSSWAYTHNKHHANPNQVDEDPDINMPILAFSEEQALKKKGLAKLIVKYQAYLWFLIVLLVPGFSVPIGTTKMLVNNLRDREWKSYIAEGVFHVAGLALYFGLLIGFLGWWKAGVFAVIHHLLAGLYMGTTFATNHKAMPLVKEKLDFLRAQVLTARNVRSNPIVDLWTGGLNYQIEHHLFPTMPRNNLGKARAIVKPFCEKVGVEYYETGFFRTYKEILQHLHKVSSVLRNSKASG